MNAIPKNLRMQLSEDSFYWDCCITGASRSQEKIEWHHNLIFAGSQVQQKFAILPLAGWVHDRARETNLKEKLDWIMLNRATAAELIRFSKVVDYTRMRRTLNEKFGKWKEGKYPGV